MIPSNYPPGVSGNEPEIVGYDEMELACANCDETVTLYGSNGYYTGSCSCGWELECHQGHEDLRDTNPNREE